MTMDVFTKENESKDEKFIDLMKRSSDKIFEIGYIAGKSGLDEEIAKSMISSVMEVLITAAIKQAKSEKKRTHKMNDLFEEMKRNFEIFCHSAQKFMDAAKEQNTPKAKTTDYKSWIGKVVYV